MKYLKKFESEADKKAWLAGSEFVSPNVVLTGDVVEYNIIDPSTIPLHIEAIENLTIGFGNTYEYSKDNATWSSGTSETSISANAGEKVYFRASGLTPSSSSGIGAFTISNGKCNIAGNVMSMAYGADFQEKIAITNNHQFYKLFIDCSTIVDVSSLVLPATTLAQSCYDSMFIRCTSLVNAPALPATTLAQSCYSYMFSMCGSLVNAPTLPATTLAKSCYQNMFYKCTSLVSAPALPATTLAQLCYSTMFYGCTSLVSAPALPATALAQTCYNSMFYDCTSLVNAPTLPATTLQSYCYQSMFCGCTSLVSAPALPATTLAQSCYLTMFKGCSNLNYIKAMFTTTPSSYYTGEWVDGVASTGKFIKNSVATWTTTGADGVPSGWTVETAAA